MQFCEKLYALRQERGLTQKQVGEALSMAARQYQRFEKGEQKPGFDNLRNMADFYGVSVDWLMGRTERREVWRSPGPGGAAFRAARGATTRVAPTP